MVAVSLLEIRVLPEISSTRSAFVTGSSLGGFPPPGPRGRHSSTGPRTRQLTQPVLEARTRLGESRHQTQLVLKEIEHRHPAALLAHHDRTALDSGHGAGEEDRVVQIAEA